LKNEVIGMVSQNKVLPGLIAVEKHGVLDLLDSGLDDYIKRYLLRSQKCYLKDLDFDGCQCCETQGIYTREP
jgi:hypothetical protein